MGPIGKRGRWIILGGGLAVIIGVAGLLSMARPEAPEPVQVTQHAQAPAPAATQAPAAQTDTAPGAEEILWSPRYDFALEVDGKPSPEACFYQERHSRRILISAPDLNKVCILNQDGMQVTAIDRSKVKIEPDGEQASLLPGADTSAPGSQYTVDQSSVVFYVGPSRLKIFAKQPLVGPTTTGDILTHSPLYNKGMREYTPAAADIAYLKSYPGTIDIEVFFGTWCPHCKVLVPKFMKTMAQAGNPKLRVSYHGVPTGFDAYEPARGKRVVGIPTFIFWKNSEEVGRIPGDPGNDTIEHAVAQILAGIKP